MSFENKLVALVNKDIDVGVAMNEITHRTIGLGAQLNAELLKLNDYKDKEGNVYPNIDQMPLMILRVNPVKSGKRSVLLRSTACSVVSLRIR